MTRLSSRRSSSRLSDRRRPIFLPFLAVGLAVYLNVVPARVTDGVAAIPSVDEVTAKAQSGATPFNAAPQTEVDSLVANRGSVGASDRSQLLSAGVAPDSVHGIDGKGRHYLIERSPKWPMIEFRMRLKQPETIVDR